MGSGHFLVVIEDFFNVFSPVHRIDYGITFLTLDLVGNFIGCPMDESTVGVFLKKGNSHILVKTFRTIVGYVRFLNRH